ncbi:ATP-binding cassette domain-containing protein [Treponema phagedenis]|uniref:ATP-binding cassette domain-containing protein n=1 Tax=Treponema phagedenis TaxID=162 RepID=UPI0011F01A83|nr:ATP-binding cassette domain-containing protein [Treponema phagedenis]TYT76370.1 ATP-binding cassette domain-containing protein [Treponema phagedenis]
MHALDNINFTGASGRKPFAFVGESGSGKSTIMQLIMGLRHPQEGRVVIDDFGPCGSKPAKLPQTHCRRAAIGGAFFRAQSKTILPTGFQTSAMKQFSAQAKLATPLSLSKNFPRLSNQSRGSTAQNFPGGQRQRIAIARALIQKSDILIFDEATSALDVISKNWCRMPLIPWSKAKTCLLLRTGFPPIRSADKLFVLRKGEIVESGTYQELINANGEFARLQSLQTR